MSKITRLLFIIVAAAGFMVGCSQDYSPTGSAIEPTPLMATSFEATTGTLESATLHLWVNFPSNQVITAHRVTADWNEAAVSWNSFGGAFDPTVEGSFLCDGGGWRTVDVTSLANAWLNGTADNFGILLQQPEHEIPRAFLSSREGANPPMLELCFTTPEGPACTQYSAVADASLMENYPDDNVGDIQDLFVGWVEAAAPEKQALVRFDLPAPPPPSEGCTFTIGYWKNHAGCGRKTDVVTPLLPVTLGSREITSARMARDILTMGGRHGRRSNGIVKMMAQLLAAKLNAANGADTGALGDAMDQADNFLTDHGPRSWRRLSHDEKRWVLNLKTLFDNYNNGVIGPGHCD